MKSKFGFRILEAALLAAVGSGLFGCAHYPVNEPKTAADSDGYYYRNHQRENNSDEILFLLAFSGGGTRAASFSYGLLEALRDVTYDANGQSRRMLDEVDVISSVSGGSFTAAAYGLYGDQMFEVFEPAFLKRNIQRTLLFRFFRPWNWPALSSPTYNWSELAADYYDKILFHGATFQDLYANNSPHLIINATDISTGTRISFNQEFFDIFSSEVSRFPISRAVASSSAVPGLLTPVVLNNYAGKYPVPKPPWLEMNYAAGTGAAHVREARYRHYLDSEAQPYIHLCDGGVSDNLGLRLYMDTISVLNANPALLQKQPGLQKVRSIVLIVVNSFVYHDKEWSQSEKVAGHMATAVAANARIMERYSEDTLIGLRSVFQEFKKDQNLQEKLDFYAIEVDFQQVEDPGKLKYLLSLPTSFVLKHDVVDELKQTARTLLFENEEFQRLVSDLEAQIQMGGGAAPTNVP